MRSSKTRSRALTQLAGHVATGYTTRCSVKPELQTHPVDLGHQRLHAGIVAAEGRIRHDPAGLAAVLLLPPLV